MVYFIGPFMEYLMGFHELVDGIIHGKLMGPFKACLMGSLIQLFFLLDILLGKFWNY